MATGFRSEHGRWKRVWFSFLVDALFVWIAFVLGVWLRFGEIGLDGIWKYAPGIALGSVVLPSVLYVGGFYSEGGPETGWLSRLRWLLGALVAVLFVALALGSVDFSSRIGRGVLGFAYGLLVPLVFLRHFRELKWRSHRWERILCVVTTEEDEAAAALLAHLWGGEARNLGVVSARGYRPKSPLPHDGDLDTETLPQRVDIILVRDQHIADPHIGPFLRRQRYEGVEIVSMADACEEAYQALPLGLVTESWLFRASNQPGRFYIRKMKRLFDVSAALFFLVALSPFFLLGVMLVKLASPGPVLYRQMRAGRLERPITVIKLRTMRPNEDTDGNGAGKWSGSDDDRIFPGGRFLRKFRIDEIPQLWNVLRGDMSFVGPRPEQTSLIEQLDAEVPFYRERLLVQPGLTGWAQVRYPYGASVEDAARKLEYDLYYMKHMSLFLDFFILLETVKVILQGGVKREGDLAFQEFRKSLEDLSDPRNGNPDGMDELPRSEGTALSQR